MQLQTSEGLASIRDKGPEKSVQIKQNLKMIIFPNYKGEEKKFIMKFGETIKSNFSDKESGENKVEKKQRKGEITVTAIREERKKLGSWEEGTENNMDKNRPKVPLKSAQQIAFSLGEEESYSQQHKLQLQIHKKLIQQHIIQIK